MFATRKFSLLLRSHDCTLLPSRSLLKSGRNDRLSLSRRRGMNTERGGAKDQQIKPDQAGNGPRRDGSLAIGLVTLTSLGGLWFNNWSIYYASSPIERALNWTPHVKHRIESTYGYLGTSAVISFTVSGLLLFSHTVTKLIARFPISIALTSYTIANLSYYFIKTTHPNDPVKKIAWFTNCASYSPILIASSKLLGPPVFRAYFYALCILGSISVTAITSPSESVFRTSAPLSIALAILASSALGSRYLLPPPTYLRQNSSGIVLTVGLIIFTISILRDRTIENAEMYPLLTRVPYDPISEGADIYNKRLRIAELLKMFRDVDW